MGTEKNLYEKIQEYLGLEEENISILEESINTDTQLEYFEYSKNHSSKKNEADIIRDKEKIFDIDLSLSQKKTLLVELASISNIEAYRTIERYLNQPNINLHDWACLALQESRIHLESNLLDKSKILITTGLGGKGLNLRYFIVLFSRDNQKLTEVQRCIITKEVTFCLKRKGAVLEDIVFDDSFASILAMIPIQVHLQDLFYKILRECNLLGDFLYNDFIITNVKAMSSEEIIELLRINNIY